MGDYGWPCFQLAKRFKKAPPLIALELAAKISPDKYIKSVSAKGPYLNIMLDKQAVIEYVCTSPNIAKPMNIGHLRSTVIGAALKRIYEYLGYKVVSINHIGDWGTQFGKLALAYKKWADTKKMEEDPINELYRIYVKIHQEVDADKSLEDEARGMFKRLENGDREITDLWRKFVDLSWQDFNRVYDKLGIKFDSVAGESFYHKMIPDVLELLEEKKLSRKSQGALIVPLCPGTSFQTAF